MKIGILTTEFPTHGTVGGLSAYCRNLYAGLEAAGHEPHILLVTREPQNAEAKEKAWRVHHVQAAGRMASLPYPFGRGASMALGCALHRVIGELQLDVVEAADVGSLSGFLPRPLPNNAALVLRLHTGRHVLEQYANRAPASLRERVAGWISQRIEARELRRADAVSAVSQAVVQRTLADLSQAGREVRVIANPVADEFFAIEPPSGVAAGNAFRVLNVARLAWVKGSDLLIAAWPAVVEAMPETQLTIAGEDSMSAPGGGSMREFLEEQIRRLGISASVDLTGYVEPINVAALLAAADLCVFPSRWEGMPVALAEAMAAARCSVVSGAPAMREAVTDNVDGRIVDAADARALSGEIIRLLQSHGERARLGETARETARSRFSISTITQQTLALYREALANVRGEDVTAAGPAAFAGEAPARARRALGNAVLNGWRLLSALIAATATSAILARSLGPAATGEYTLAVWWAAIVAAICHLGIPDALARYLAEAQGAGRAAEAAALNHRLLRTQFYAVAGATIVSAAAMWTFHIAGAPVRWAFLLFIFTTGSMQALTAALSGFQRYGWLLAAVTAGGATQVAGVLLAAHRYPSPAGMVIAVAAGAAVTNIVCLAGLSHSLWAAASTETIAPLLRRARSYSAFMWYLMMLDLVVWHRSEVLFLQWRSSKEQIAFYGLAFAIASRIDEITSPLAGTLVPLFAEEMGRSGKQAVTRLYAVSMRAMPLAIVPICFYLMVIAPELVTALYGARFAPVAPVLRILLMGVAIMSSSSAGQAAMAALEQQSFSARWGTLIAVVNIMLAWSLAPRLGALGAALANSTAQVLAVVISLNYLHKLIREPFPWRALCVVWAASMVSALALAPALLLHWNLWLLAASVLLCVALYYFLLRVMGGLSDVDLILAALRRPRTVTEAR